MKGLWKENLGGYNHKDTKRKKQTRKHSLKDNGNYIIRTFDGFKKSRDDLPEVFRNESYTVKIITNNKPIITTAKIYNALIKIQDVDDYGQFIPNGKTSSGYKEIIKEINFYRNENEKYFYNKNKSLYIEKNNKKINEEYNLTPAQLIRLEIINPIFTNKIKILPKEMIQEALERKNKIKKEDFQKECPFIYNKPITHWKIMTFFNDGKRRKIAQNRANRMDRRNIKNWINNHDISKPLKTHALSKSILWEIY